MLWVTYNKTLKSQLAARAAGTKTPTMKKIAFLASLISCSIFASTPASWQVRIDDYGCVMLIEPRFNESEILECGDFCSVLSQFSFMLPNSKAPILNKLNSEPMTLIHGVTIATRGITESVQISSVDVKIEDTHERLFKLQSEPYSGYLTGEVAEKVKKHLLKSDSLSYNVNYSNGKSTSYNVPTKFFIAAQEMFETCKKGLNSHGV